MSSDATPEPDSWECPYAGLPPEIELLLQMRASQAFALQCLEAVNPEVRGAALRTLIGHWQWREVPPVIWQMAEEEEIDGRLQRAALDHIIAVYAGTRNGQAARFLAAISRRGSYHHHWGVDGTRVRAFEGALAVLGAELPWHYYVARIKRRDVSRELDHDYLDRLLADLGS